MTSEKTLPKGFSELEPFVGQWAIACSADRLAARLGSTDAERRAFFEAGQGLVEPALQLLDGKPSAQYSAAEVRLMNLVLTLAHVSLAVEIQGDDEAFHARYAQYITIGHSAADRLS